MISWVKGVVVSAVGNAAISFGTVRQQRAATAHLCAPGIIAGTAVVFAQNLLGLAHQLRQRRIDSNLDAPALKSLWQYHVGWVLYILGNVLTFASLGYAAQGVVIAVGSMQFVCDALFSTFIMQDPKQSASCLGLVLICVGSAFLVAFGNKESPALQVKNQLTFTFSSSYIIYVAVVLGGVVPGAYMTTAFGHNWYRGRSAPGWAVKAIPIAFCLYAGPIGAQATLLSACLSSMLGTIAKDFTILISLYFYMTVIAAIALNIVWILLMNTGLKLFPSEVIVPDLQIVWTIFVLISGGIFSQSFKEATSLEMGMLVLGAMVLSIGILWLTPSKQAAGPPALEETACPRSQAQAVCLSPPSQTSLSLQALIKKHSSSSATA